MMVWGKRSVLEELLLVPRATVRSNESRMMIEHVPPALVLLYALYFVEVATVQQ